MRWSMLLLCWCSAIAFAQPAWKPDRPVEIIIGAAPGGANDRIGRSLQRGLQDGKYANPVIVMNKPGGGQSIATSYLSQRPPDGHALMLASVPLLTSRLAGKGAVSFTELTPVTQLFHEYIAFAVKNDSPHAGGLDLVAARQSHRAGLLAGGRVVDGRGAAGAAGAGLDIILYI